MDNSSPHYSNIEWIRAFSSIAVVALHYHFISPAQTIGDSFFGALFNGYVLRLAVPLFMLVSLFLFTGKKRSSDYLGKKIKHLLFLALIWSFIYSVFNFGLSGYITKLADMAKEIKSTPSLFFYYLFTDMETIFYFFISLPIIIIIASLLYGRSCFIIGVVLVASVLVIAILPFFNGGSLASFYNPINFVPYAPIAVLINRYRERLFVKKTQFGLLSLVIGAFFMAYEIYTAKYVSVSVIDGYTKNSLVFFSAGILLISLSTAKTNRVIFFMSQHSLPLYLFHTCFFTLVGTICNIVVNKALHIPSSYNHMYAWLVAITLCYLTSAFIAPHVLNTKIYAGA